MQHSFNINIAAEYGILEAILLQNLYFWIKHNEANEKSFYDGSYWTFNSIKAFGELFPYASEKKIRTALEHLKEAGLIKTGNYNKSAYDRTLWYALTDKGFSFFQNEKIHLPKKENGNSQKGEPIPDNKQRLKTQINNTTNVVLDAKAPMEYGNQKINEMFVKWEQMFGYMPTNSPQNRRAVYNMLRAKDKGEEWLEKTMLLLLEAQKDKYAGKDVLGIANFADLQAKRDKVWKWGSSKAALKQKAEEDIRI